MSDSAVTSTVASTTAGTDLGTMGSRMLVSSAPKAEGGEAFAVIRCLSDCQGDGVKSKRPVRFDGTILVWTPVLVDAAGVGCSDECYVASSTAGLCLQQRFCSDMMFGGSWPVLAGLEGQKGFPVPFQMCRYASACVSGRHIGIEGGAGGKAKCGFAHHEALAAGTGVPILDSFVRAAAAVELLGGLAGDRSGRERCGGSVGVGPSGTRSIHAAVADIFIALQLRDHLFERVHF